MVQVLSRSSVSLFYSLHTIYNRLFWKRFEPGDTHLWSIAGSFVLFYFALFFFSGDSFLGRAQIPSSDLICCVNFVGQLFSQRQSLLKLAPLQSTKGEKASYCLACLFSLVEQV